MPYEIGVNAARMGRFAAWEWGKAIVVEARWTPPGQAHGTTAPGQRSQNSLSVYREGVAREAGMELDDMPSDETLRTRAIAYFHANDYRDEIAISTAYEAAVAVTAGKFDGTVPELLEEARGEDGRIRVDDVRAVLDRPRTGPLRPRNMVQHAQHAGQHLRLAAEEFLARDELPTGQEMENLLATLRQLAQFVAIFLARVEGRDAVETELQEMMTDASA